MNLLRQQPHRGNARVKGLQCIGVQQLSLETEGAQLNFHLACPLPVQYAETDAVRRALQALPQGAHRDPRQRRPPLSLVIIRKACDAVLRPHQAREHRADLPRTEQHHRFHPSGSFLFLC